MRTLILSRWPLQMQPPNRRPDAYAAEAAWHASAVAHTADIGEEGAGLDAAAARHDLTAQPVAAWGQHQAARDSASDRYAPLALLTACLLLICEASAHRHCLEASRELFGQPI